MSLEMALTRGVFRLVPRMLDSEELTRRSMALPRRGARRVPCWMRRKHRISDTTVAGMRVTRVEPRATGSGTVVVYLHGGAYVSPISWAHWLLIDALVERTGAAAVVPAYPRAPEHTAAEAFAPLGVLMDQVLDAPGRAVLAGDSAGGGLALSLAIQRRDAGVRAPDGLVLFSPWVDVSMSNPRIAPMARLDPMLGIDGLVWCGKEWAGGLGTADPRLPGRPGHPAARCGALRPQGPGPRRGHPSARRARRDPRLRRARPVPGGARRTRLGSRLRLVAGLRAGSGGSRFPFGARSSLPGRPRPAGAPFPGEAGSGRAGGGSPVE